MLSLILDHVENPGPRLFNLLQRRDACFHAQLIATKPYFQASANEIQSIKSKDIEAALDNNTKRTYNTETNSALNKLLQHIKTVGGRVMGSAYSRTALRTRIHALIFNQGLPSIFLTINPADIHSPVALYFAGVQLNLDKIQNEQLMDTYRRAEIIASHPVATAKFFHVLISNILETMIMGGVLGPIKTYFGTVESQGRGSLHLHLLIWLDHDMKPTDMKEKIQDATFRNKLIAYLEDIIKEDLDDFKEKQVIESSDEPQSSQNNIYTALRTIDLTGTVENTHQSPLFSTPTKQHLPSQSIPSRSPSIPYRSPVSSPVAQTPTHDRSAFVFSDMNVSSNQSKLPPACLPTPNPSSPNFKSKFRAHVAQVAESSNTHRHCDTCFKYCNGGKKICRSIMPRKRVPVSTIDPETGRICMKRSDPWMNNFNEYIISACRSNMDIKFIWTGNDAKALVYYITDYVTKMNLSFHDTFSLVQKSITSLQNPNNQVDKENVIEKSRKLVLRCYNALASQQELSGVQVASYLMNWDDHYTTHKFRGLYLIQTERFLQSELNEMRAKQNLQSTSQDVIDDEDIFDDETIIEENNDEEHFQVQPAGDKNNFILVNTRVDYQYRSNNLNNTCLYDFVSTFYKKKINETDIKYLSKSYTTEKRQDNQKGRPSNERFFFHKDHPQATTHLLMKYSEAHVPVLYGPQIPRQDRDDTRERYNRALLTLFVPWRNVIDLCDINQTWEDALESRKHRISAHSWKIIENIQLLHECKKDRDEHLLQVIAEAQVDNDSIDPAFLPSNQGADGEHEADDIDDLIQLIGSVDEFTAATINATKKSTENVYIRETIEAVEKVGRFNHMNRHDQHVSNTGIDQQIVPFVSATPNLIKLNSKWQDQLKNEKERIRRSLISGKHNNDDDILDFNDVTDAVVTVVNPYDNRNNVEKKTSIPPVLVVKNNFSTQNSIIDEFTLNKEQRAAFLIITSHLDGDNRCRTGDNNGQLIMCIPGCGGTGKSQLIRALTKYFLITKRMQMMRKLAPTGIAAAEIDGMTIHSFLGEQRNSRKPRTIKPGDSKLEKEWRSVEYLLIDEMSMVGLTLLGKLNRIICSAKHVDPQVPFGGVNVIFFGDYLQYRPVYDSPLHTDFSLPSKKRQGKLLSEKEIQQRVARSLILQMNCVVKLTQQMRTEDLRCLQLLDRLRHGQCNYDDYELLQTRIVGQPSIESLHDSPWNKAPILVFRNEIRTKLNNKASIHNATQIDHPLMVCVAQDTCKGKPIEDPILIKNLLELSDSKTEHLPGLLPFVPGMPVILTQNIATELGLINGIKGTFRQLVYHEESVSTEALSEMFPNNTQFIRRPIYALIEINKSKIECKLQDLEPKLIPIPLVEQTFRVDIADILPKDKKPKSNQKTILSIKRSALPLVPAYCITTHKSQGQTLNKVIIDLKLPNETDDIAAVYVPLSRVKRLVDLAILRPFDYKVLLMKPNKSQVAEMEQLDQLYINTRLRFPEWFQ
ncbi:unnamed protein product [Rotaria sordida]|uniref:ATP-dependent DNA helicase n=1 Tax=Rotaria sordida TaxID=392033 RepID=A0A814NV61_9BILA|nr:unnamed protein product [Rotaria sordida]CAF1095359.1 unnamed protein product [Rotaria sordida]